MKHEVPFRVIVTHPLDGVTMQVQRGKDELLPAKESNTERLIFEFEISIELSGSQPNFLGRYTHGPKDARFVYVNSGTYAAQHPTMWGRRAKLSLMTISLKEVEQAINDGSVFETTIPGVGRDGGPTSASVKDLKWNLVKK